MSKLKLQLGSTVLYKGQHWLAVAYDGISLLHIMQPEKGNSKRAIKPSSVQAVIDVPPAKLVTIDRDTALANPQLGPYYLVTEEGVVISKQTLRVIKCETIRKLVLEQTLTPINSTPIHNVISQQIGKVR